jgi:predicted GNAT family acetyltransferase
MQADHGGGENSQRTQGDGVKTVVRTPADVAAFLSAALPFLLAEEARHNLILGLAQTLRDTPALYPEARFWIVEEDGEVIAAALRTPPHNLVLARPRDDSAIEILAESIDEDLPGVSGALPEAGRFADAWLRRTGGARSAHAQGIYALETVLPTRPAPGRARDATAADMPLLVEWWDAFALEALGERGNSERTRRTIEHQLDPASSAGIVLWEDPEPVSLAGFGGETPNGIRVAPVYTPPQLRGRGHATALVSALSARLLVDGRRFCFLYTDLANPTSNRIYQTIGYERVCDASQITFV